MTPADLSRRGEALYGEHWKEPLRSALSVTRRALDRWLDGTRGIPDRLSADLEALERATAKATKATQSVLGTEFHARVIRD